jgi:hypothetical protein
MMDDQFYLSTSTAHFIPLTEEWSVWGTDLNWGNQICLKHIGCTTEQNVNNYVWIGKNNFDLRKKIVCIRCGKLVPKDIRKLLLLSKLNITI